jgi:hypothetical protein
MRISEMQRREDFSSILSATLAKGWAVQFGTRFSVDLTIGDGQHWRKRTLFNAYATDNLTKECRRFFRDSFRFTPVAWRLPFQYLVGSIGASRPGLVLTAKPGFRVVPAVSGTPHKIVVPGNLRVRVFDFFGGTARVLLKEGFSSAGFQREIEVRGDEARGPFPPIIAHNSNDGWFEEPIVEGFALPRCPPSISRRRVAEIALENLDGWSNPTSHASSGEELSARLLSDLRATTDVIEKRFNSTVDCANDRSWDSLLGICRLLGPVETAVTHGDFQAGNILVSRDGNKVLISDFEHSMRRFSLYDRFVFGLNSRSPIGLGKRIINFVNGETPWVLQDAPADKGWRAAVAAIVILEDLNWYSTECLSGPFLALSRGFRQYCDEANRVMPELSRVVA